MTADALNLLDDLIGKAKAAGADAVPDSDMLVNTFTEDGVFDVTNPVAPGQEFPVQGHEQLSVLMKRLAMMPSRAPRHYTTNILIEPTAAGARGSAYALIVRNGEDGERPYILAKAVYHDQLVKTPEGWRFKKRTGTFHRFGDELLDAWAQ